MQAWCAQHGHTRDAAGNALFAPVTTFASHAWGGSFAALEDALDQHSAAETGVAFFLDIVMINQFVPPWPEEPALDQHSVPPAGDRVLQIHIARADAVRQSKTAETLLVHL